MSPTKKQFLARVLDAIEQEEARLLVWGVVDGYFEPSELTALIDYQIDVAIAAQRASRNSSTLGAYWLRCSSTD